MSTSVLHALEQGRLNPEGPLRMPRFELTALVNGWLITVSSRVGTEEYSAPTVSDAAERLRSLAERWERVVERYQAAAHLAKADAPPAREPFSGPMWQGLRTVSYGSTLGQCEGGGNGVR